MGYSGKRPARSVADVRIVADLHALPFPDGPEELAGAVEAPADGGVGAADDLGDLLAGEAVDVAERQDGLVLRGQAVERHMDAGAGLGALAGQGRVARTGIGQAAEAVDGHGLAV